MEQNQIKFLSFDDMWGIKGRIGRLHYALVMVRLVVLSFILFSLLPVAATLVALLGVSPEIAQAVFMLLVFTWLLLSSFSTVIRRVQDIGYPYWTVLIVLLLTLLIPNHGGLTAIIGLLLIFAVLVALVVMPGDKQKNKYGHPVENAEEASSYRWMKPSTKGIAVFGIVFILAGVLLISFEEYIPAQYMPEGLEAISIQ